MHRIRFCLLVLAAILAASTEVVASRSIVNAMPANLADLDPARPKRRDPVARFAAIIAATDYAHRLELEEAHRRLESEIDAEIEHRRASGARMSRFDLRELGDARAMLRSSLATMMGASEDSWERARRQTQLTLDALRTAYSALYPHQLAMR
jgi:hypothetical protein